MKIPMKPITALVAVSAMTVALAGCSASGGGESTDKLLWWTTQQTASIQDSQKIWQEVGDRFTEETGIEVEVEVVPWSDLYNKILGVVSSGTGPDLINIGTSWTASLQDTGAFAPATGDNLDAMGGSDRFVESAWDAAHVPDSDQAVMPLLSAVYALYYRPSLFEAAGITEPPSTWEQFVEDAKKLTVDTNGDGQIDQWGFTSHVASPAENSHNAFTFGAQEGGSFVDEEGNATLSSPAMVSGITEFVDLMTVDQVMSPSDAELETSTEPTDQFVDGKAAMMFHQNPLQQFDSRGFTDWQIAEIPVIEGGEDIQSMVAGTNIVVSADSSNIEAAFELVGFATSAEEQAFLADKFSVLPVVNDAYDTEPFASNGDTTVETRQSILANNSGPFPLVPNIGEIETAVGDAMRLMFQDYATGKDPNIEGRLEEADASLQ